MIAFFLKYQFVIGIVLGMFIKVFLSYLSHNLSWKRKAQELQIKEIDNKISKLYSPFYIKLIDLSQNLEQLTNINEQFLALPNHDGETKTSAVSRLMSEFESVREEVRTTGKEIKKIVQENFALIEKEDHELIINYYKNVQTKWYGVLANPATQSEPEEITYYSGGLKINELLDNVIKRKQELEHRKTTLLS